MFEGDGHRLAPEPTSHMTFDPSTRSRLNLRHFERFEGDSLFARVARTVCEAECLPRKELYESWEVARRVRRRLRGGRVVDLAAGHGLVAILMLVLDDTSPSAICVDRAIPPSAERLLERFVARWPRLAGRISHVEGPIASVTLMRSDLIVSVHACGALTDRVLEQAIGAQANVAVLPCCHDATICDTGGLTGWMLADVAIDATRAARLTAAGYQVRTQRIDEAITPKNRLLIGQLRPSPTRQLT